MELNGLTSHSRRISVGKAEEGRIKWKTRGNRRGLRAEGEGRERSEIFAIQLTHVSLIRRCDIAPSFCNSAGFDKTSINGVGLLNKENNQPLLQAKNSFPTQRKSYKVTKAKKNVVLYAFMCHHYALDVNISRWPSMVETAIAGPKNTSPIMRVTRMEKQNCSSTIQWNITRKIYHPTVFRPSLSSRRYRQQTQAPI